MYDNYAEALDDTVVCVMSRTDVNRLPAYARIAARITALLGRRPADLEQRLSHSTTAWKSRRPAYRHHVTSTQPPAGPLRPARGHPRIALTHAALAGTSRETCTKVPRDYADHGMLRLTRGRITVLAPNSSRRRKAPAHCRLESPRTTLATGPDPHRSSPCVPAPSSRPPSLPPSSL